MNPWNRLNAPPVFRVTREPDVAEQHDGSVGELADRPDLGDEVEDDDPDDDRGREAGHACAQRRRSARALQSTQVSAYGSASRRSIEIRRPAGTHRP